MLTIFAKYRRYLHGVGENTEKHVAKMYVNFEQRLKSGVKS